MDGGNKTQSLTDMVSVILCQNMADKIQMVYTDIKIAEIPRLVTKWYPLLIIIILFFVTNCPQKFFLTTRNLLKTDKKLHSLASGWW